MEAEGGEVGGCAARRGGLTPMRKLWIGGILFAMVWIPGWTYLARYLTSPAVAPTVDDHRRILENVGFFFGPILWIGLFWGPAIRRVPPEERPKTTPALRIVMGYLLVMIYGLMCMQWIYPLTGHRAAVAWSAFIVGTPLIVLFAKNVDRPRDVKTSAVHI